MAALTLDTPLATIRSISPRFLKCLKRLGIETVKELLWHFPTRYEDFSRIVAIAELEPGEEVTIQGTVRNVTLHRTWRRHLSVVEVIVADGSGELKVVWFNQPYLLHTLRRGREANFAGKVSVSEEGELYLSHPTYEVVGTRATRHETTHTARLVPVYPETKGLTSKGLRFLIQPILKNIPRLPEWIPREVLREKRLPEINIALHTLHFPHSPEEAVAARTRFAFEELFLLQLWNLKQKAELRGMQAPPIHTDINEVKAILAELPFKLTFSQKKSLWEIIQDLAKSHPMNRLLQGDVGSGKTVVTVLAALLTARHGFQTAFMAPTEVLVHQHFETLKKLCANIHSVPTPGVGLLSGGGAKLLYEDGLEIEVKKEELKKKIKNGEVSILVGTHALIQKSTSFEKLGLIIIDEQHRFGVKQRATLSSQPHNRLIPHFLSMSATPIPRTLMLTIFGDLDISLITELPAGRRNIVTSIVSPRERVHTYQFIREEVKRGRQVFVICPRIDVAQTNADTGSPRSALRQRQSATFETKAVKEEYEKLSQEIFPDLRVAILHGQMKPKEKEKIMNEFRAGKNDILVSTSVVEIGVDVPNATIMMVEGAEQFGLAQLYQFRGRVGRGEHQSYCLFFTTSEDQTNRPRLKAVLTAKNGFELAEKDLKIRGPGEFLGEAQTGLPDVAMHALQDVDLVKSAREAAVKIIQKDKELRGYPLLTQKVGELQKEIHLE